MLIQKIQNTKKEIMKAPDSGINQTIPIPSHLAMAVFYEATGKTMEKWDLVRHPYLEIRKQWNHSVANKYGRLMKKLVVRKITAEAKSVIDMTLSNSSRKKKYLEDEK